MKKKKLVSKFFNKQKSKEKIYTDNHDKNDEFIENKIFASTYFYKTHIHWNILPLDIKIIEDYDEFKTKLEQYLWDTVLELTDNLPTDSSSEAPGE